MQLIYRSKETLMDLPILTHININLNITEADILVIKRNMIIKAK